MHNFDKYLCDEQREAIQHMVLNTVLPGDLLCVVQVSEEQTRNGIVIPDTASNAGEKRGLVVHAGKGIWANGAYKEMEPKVGDIVRFDRGRLGNEQVIHEIEYDNEKFVILPESIVLMIERQPS